MNILKYAVTWQKVTPNSAVVAGAYLILHHLQHDLAAHAAVLQLRVCFRYVSQRQHLIDHGLDPARSICSHRAFSFVRARCKNKKCSVMFLP